VNALRRHLSAALLLVVGLVAFFPRTVASGFRATQGVSVDPRHLNFVVEYAHRCLVGDAVCRGLWNPPIFFPQANVAGLTEPLFGLLPLYTPWRLLGASPSLAFALLEVALVAATFLATYALFARRFALAPTAAALGAYLFAFGNPRGAQIGHPHTFAAAPLVLALAALAAELAQSRAGGDRRRHVPLAVAAFVWLYLSNIYFALFAALLALAALPWALAQASTRAALAASLRRRGALWLVSLAGGGALLAPVVRHQRAWAEILGWPPWEAVRDLLPQPESWLNPGALNWVWGAVARWPPIAGLAPSWEHELGIGFVTLALALAGLWLARRDPWLRVAAGAAATLALLATRWPGGFSLWRGVLLLVPPLSATRAMGRLALVVLLLAAYGVAVAWQRLRVDRRVLLAALLLVVVPLEQARRGGSFPRRALDLQSSRLAAAVPRSCTAFFFSPVDFATPSDAATQEVAMWAALEAGVPTVNGYTSYPPPRWNLWDPGLRGEADRLRLRGALDDWLRRTGFHGELCWLAGAPLPGAPPIVEVERLRF
jgi:hypothetical protein